MARDLQESLLRRGDAIRASSLFPLYLSVFLKMLASGIAMWPLGALKVFFCALATGSDEASAAVVVGVMTALRYLTEFVGAEVLVSLSWVSGYRGILVASSTLLAMECGLMAMSSTPTTLGVVHVVFGFAFSAGSLESHCIVGSLKSRKKQMAVHERLLDLVAIALVVGPVLSGRLTIRYGYAGPLICGYLLSIAAVYAIGFWVPQHPAPKVNPNRKDGSFVVTPRSLVGTPRMIEQPGPSVSQGVSHAKASPKYAWFCCAMVLSGMGMAAFGATFVLWMKVCLRRETQGIFDCVAFANFLQVLSRTVPLPHFMNGMNDKKHLAVQICLGITALRFLALAIAPTELWTLVILVATLPGFYATQLLSDLCASHAPSAMLDTWSLRLACLNTLASAIGALAGSRLLASAFNGSLSSASPLLFSSACYFLAGACVSQGSQAQSGPSMSGVSATSLEGVV